MRREIVVLQLLLLGATPLAPLAAQEQPAGSFGERVEVTEVLLDVLVTDDRGNVVIGLTPQDFVVEEEGRPVALTSASFYSNRRFVQSSELAKSLGVDTRVWPSDRYFVLLFQDDRTAAPRLASQYLDAARYTRQWLGELLPNDYVAIASYDAKLKIWQDFTSNKEDAARAVNAIFDGKSKALENWPSRQREDSGPSLLTRLPQGKKLRQETRKIYDGLRLLGEAMTDIRGRKNILFFSLGFGETRSFGVWTPDPRYYPAMVQSLNDRNVAIYAVDLIPTTEQPSIQDRGTNQALSQLAADTGGRYYFQFTDFLFPLQQMADENNGYYLLSYQAQFPLGTSGYRQVRVSTVNPAFQVRARQGYRFGD